MKLKTSTLFIILFIATAITPASACSPAFNAAYPAMLSSWLVWLIAACFLAGKDTYIKRNLMPWFLFPISFALFMIPIPPWLAVLNGVFFISFSISNIMEFLAALSSKEGNKKQGRNRLLFFGLPVLTLTISGIVFRGLYYTSASGIIRVFTDRGILIYSVCLLLGTIVYVIIDGKEGKTARDSASGGDLRQE